MTNKEKKVVIILVAIMILVLLVVVVVKSFGKGENVTNTQGNETTNDVVNEEKYVTQLNDGTKLNNSEALNSTKKYNDLEISNIQFTSQNGSSVLLGTITNTGSQKHESEIVKITIIGENDEVIAEPLVSISELDPGESRQLNVIVTADIANAKDFKIEAMD